MEQDFTGGNIHGNARQPEAPMATGMFPRDPGSRD
jgi:hypothetical protein